MLQTAAAGNVQGSTSEPNLSSPAICVRRRKIARLSRFFRKQKKQESRQLVECRARDRHKYTVVTDKNMAAQLMSKEDLHSTPICVRTITAQKHATDCATYNPANDKITSCEIVDECKNKNSLYTGKSLDSFRDAQQPCRKATCKTQSLLVQTLANTKDNGSETPTAAIALSQLHASPPDVSTRRIALLQLPPPDIATHVTAELPDSIATTIKKTCCLLKLGKIFIRKMKSKEPACKKNKTNERGLGRKRFRRKARVLTETISGGARNLGHHRMPGYEKLYDEILTDDVVNLEKTERFLKKKRGANNLEKGTESPSVKSSKVLDTAESASEIETCTETGTTSARADGDFQKKRTSRVFSRRKSEESSSHQELFSSSHRSNSTSRTFNTTLTSLKLISLNVKMDSDHDTMYRTKIVSSSSKLNRATSADTTISHATFVVPRQDQDQKSKRTYIQANTKFDRRNSATVPSKTICKPTYEIPFPRHLGEKHPVVAQLPRNKLLSIFKRPKIHRKKNTLASWTLPESSFRYDKDSCNKNVKLGEGLHGKVYSGTYVNRHGKESRACVKNFDEIFHDHEMKAEIQSLLCLRNSGCVPKIKGIYTTPGTEHRDSETGIVMQLLEGETLADFIEVGTVPPAPTVIRFLLHTARQIDRVHKKGLLINDIKMDNIMVNQKDMSARLIDFGNATGREGLCYGVLERGPNCHLAPEVCNGKNSTVSSDIYSFGATLRMVDDALKRGLEPEYTSVMRDVIELSRRCTAQDPDHRPLSMDTVVKELLKIKRGAKGIERRSR